jgi:hypothetical protein
MLTGISPFLFISKSKCARREKNGKREDVPKTKRIIAEQRHWAGDV